VDRPSQLDLLFQYQPFLEGDNRRNTQRSCLSLAKLQKIVAEGNVIYANIGTATSKISRILIQAESWFSEHQTLLVQCNIITTQSPPPHRFVAMSDMTQAVESAYSDVSLDLDEAVQLKELTEKTSTWFERVSNVSNAAAKKSKRAGRGPRLTVTDLNNLIEEAKTLPVETEQEVKHLHTQLSEVKIWKSKASQQLVVIADAFVNLRQKIDLAFGAAGEFSFDQFTKSDNVLCTDKDGGSDVEKTGEAVLSLPKSSEENEAASDSASTLVTDFDSESNSIMGNADINLHRLIQELQEGAKSLGVVTEEVEMAELLEKVCRWSLRSLKYLSTPREIFDKRFFGAFDRFIAEGEDLRLQGASIDQGTKPNGIDADFVASWSDLLNDQCSRLGILHDERVKFTAWCNEATRALKDQKKLSLEKLNVIAERSRNFPAGKQLESCCVTVLECSRSQPFCSQRDCAEGPESFRKGERLG